MVRHEGANDDALLILRHTLRRVVDRLVETVARRARLLRKTVQVPSAARGATIAASIVAYGATTRSSLKPRLRPRPGTPNGPYW